jgi:transcription initiation factor TFIIIB Brf1 subunit/transcription initiation factor TFIIB
VRLVEKLAAYGRVLPKARRNRTDMVRYVGRRPALLAAIAIYEAALMVSSGADNRLKVLAGLKVSSRVGCPF